MSVNNTLLKRGSHCKKYDASTNNLVLYPIMISGWICFIIQTPYKLVLQF